MSGAVRAERQAPQTLTEAFTAHGWTAEVKSTKEETGQGATGGEGSGGGERPGGGGGGGGGGEAMHELSEASAIRLTPLVTMAPDWAVKQAPSVGVSLGDTPAITKGVASAVMHGTQAVASVAELSGAQAATAPAKLCVWATGQRAGGGGGGGAGAGGGGGRGVGGGGEAGGLHAPVPSASIAI